VAYLLLRPPSEPPPAEIAADRLLVEGREIYLSRCASCHGSAGRGDGPVAKSLTGPNPGNLTDASTWKHGDKPEHVRKIIAGGVEKAAMPGWESTLGEKGVRSVTAYVFYLARRPVPEELRGQ
jgi:cytochrome c oxidase cbb3-type subunit 3